MPSFLHSLRRRSRSSFRTDKSSVRGSTSFSDAPVPANNKSTSTLNSASHGSNTPPSTVSPDEVGNTNGAAPPIPQRPSVSNKRYSINGSLPPTVSGSQKTTPTPTSLLAPRVLSVSDNSWVHQKVLLIYGTIGDPTYKPLDGTVTVCHHQDSFPPTTWPVSDSHFKALVHLQPGPNRIRLDFISTKASSSSTSLTPHCSFININYLPLGSSPPLQLAVIIGKDSPGTYDAVPERIQKEGNGLEIATRKFKMAAYLWQAFTGEQMQRNGFGRRCYRYEEEWQPGTLSWHDMQSGQMRNEARIHIIRSDKTVKEIRDLDLAQQYDKAKKKGDLFGVAMDAVKAYFKPKPGQTQYVSCLILDSHWDPKVQTIRGHAALGGGDGSIQLAIFGSHALQSYPSCLEEVVPAFRDCTKTDTNYVANDCNESGSNWEAVNIGIGAHLHETGHLFGCPHQESGIMLRDYVRLNRTFMTREPYSTRTKQPGQRLVLQQDECSWHRLDCLRFRFHPCFRLSVDPPLKPDGSVHVWVVDNNEVLVTAATGVAFIELYPEGNDVCHTWIEYLDPSKPDGPKHVSLNEADLRARLSEEHRKKKLKLEIHSCGQGKHVIEDFNQLASSKNARIKLPDGRWGFRAGKLGYSQMEGSQPQEVILENSFVSQDKLLGQTYSKSKLLTSIRVYHGFALDGIEFIYEDGTTQLFGKRGGKPGGTEFVLDTRRGELLYGFYLRAGLWIDGLQIITSLGRKSEIFGNPNGGSGHTLIPPRGYSIAGISGSCGPWMDGFQLIITR